MSDATNQKRYIMTVAHDKDIQCATSTGKTLSYFPKESKGKPILLKNCIETWKCSIDESCKKTFVGQWRIVHDKSRIGHPFGPWPSWYDSDAEVLDSPPHGNGTANHQTVQQFAVAAEKSPDVMVEGHWLTREFDKTWQDNHNGPGKFIYNSHETNVPDDSDLVFAQCGVEKLIMKCEHEGRETAEGELHVFFGDKVTITAVRVNLAETDPKKRSDIHCDFKLYKEKRNPPAEETQHVAFVLSRNAGKAIENKVEAWEKRENVTKVGKNTTAKIEEETLNVTILELGEDWLNKKRTESDERTEQNQDQMKDDREKAKDEKRDAAAEKDKKTVETLQQRSDTSGLRERQAEYNRRKTGYAAANDPTSPREANRVNAADNRLAQAQDKSHKDDVALGAKTAQVAGKNIGHQLGIICSTYDSLMKLFAWQPLEVTIAAHGCSKGPSAKIKAYPESSFGCDLWSLKDLPWRKPLEDIMKVVENIQKFIEAIKGVKTYKPRIKSAEGPAEPEGGLSGGDKPLYIYFFRGMKDLEDAEPKLELACEYKELEHDKTDAKGKVVLHKWMVRRSWSLEVGVDRLIGLHFNVKVPLLDIGALVFLEKFLHFLGVDAGPYFEFDVDLSCGIAGKVTFNEYGEFEAPEISIPAKAVLKVELYIQLGEAAKAGVRITGIWKAEYRLGSKEPGKACAESKPSHVDIVGDFFVDYDFSIWKGEKHYEFCNFPIEVAPAAHNFLEDKRN
jgi:hypothetical protein